MWYDVLTLCILAYATFRGAMKGIVWQLAAIATLEFCFLFAGSLSSTLAPLIRVEPPLNRWIAMFVLYMGFSFVAFGLARVVEGMLEKIKFEEYDRHLGAVLGLLKGVTFSIFLTFFLVTLSESTRESIMNSESGYAAAVIMDRLDNVMPYELHAILEPYIRRLDDAERDRLPYRDERGRRDDLVDGRERGDRPPLPDSDLRRSEGSDPFNDSDPDRAALDRRRDGGSAPFDDADRDRGRDPRRVPLRDNAPLSDRDDRRDGDLADRDAAPSWLSTLPALDAELKQLALKAWRNTKAEHRDEFKRVVTGSVPDAIRDLIRRWQNGKPALDGDVASDPAPFGRDGFDRDGRGDDRSDRDRGSSDRYDRTGSSRMRPDRRSVVDRTRSVPDRRERDRLERDIAAVTAPSDRDSDVQAAIDDMETSFKGIPDEVVLNVLRDWRADVRNERPDPDPQTSARTRLETRISRQLAKAGISPRSLDNAWQDRLPPSETR